MRSHLSNESLDIRLRRLIKQAQFESVDTIMDELIRDVNDEYEDLARDLRSVTVAEGEVSESQRFPNQATVMQGQLQELDVLVTRSNGLVERLRTVI